MKILWYSNSPWANTGYGIQTRHLVEGLIDAGHDVAVFSNYGLQGGMIDNGKMKVYAIDRDIFGMDIFGQHVKHHKADLVVTLYDLWGFPGDFPARIGTRWAPWFPVDSEPVNVQTLQVAQKADFPICYSLFGQEEMKKSGVECHYIPHGVDGSIYKPGDKKAARKALDLPEDAYVVLMVAANQLRKSYPEQIAAFAHFQKRHPEAILYIHSTKRPKTRSTDGVEIDGIVNSLGLQDCTYFTDEYAMNLGISEESMAMIYQSADVLLSGTRGEGFGVPIIEAQACGVPVVTTRFSAMPELTVNGLSVAPIQYDWNFMASWQAMPSVMGMAAALEAIYGRTKKQVAQGADVGRNLILERFDWPVVIQQWCDLLEGIESGKTRAVEEQKRHYEINGVSLDVFDDARSFTTDCVAMELASDTYGLNRIEFQDGDVVLDIGAHVGTFALYVKKRWPGVQVYSIEPSSVNFERLERNFELNGLDCAALKTAVTADGRDLNLLHNRNNTGGDTAFSKPNGRATETVRSTTLTKLLDVLGVDRVKLLKIDCEGAEHEVLKGFDLSRVDYLSGEFHENQALAAAGHDAGSLYRYCREMMPADRIVYSTCPIPD